ncbi:MAG: enoyl-CoA hydratase/isomerase family protein [Micromonosporaceae bacterium]|nr:enoyl-CoA hydratase/isomerase family protein [Micromonosporaceae bacterium]
MTGPAVEVEHHDHAVAWVWLNRPDSRNALVPDLVAELTDAVRRVGDDPRTRVLVLAGRGSAFSAGGDLTSLRAMADETYHRNLLDSQVLSRLFQSLDECPCPVVARVQGPALGGGTGLAACADVVVASESARFGCTEVRVGIIPAVIAPYLLDKLGPSAARRHLISGERLTAAQARAAGLVHEVVAPERLDPAVAAVVAELLAGDGAAQRAIKRLLPLLRSAPSRDAAVALATQESARVRVSEPARRGIDAALDRLSQRRRDSDRRKE